MVAGRGPAGLLETWFNSVDSSKQSSSSMGKQMEEPTSKRSKRVSRVPSLANLLPPVKSTPLKRIGQTLQRSISFRSDNRGARDPPPPPPHSSSSSSMKTRVISATISNPPSSSSSSVSAPRVSLATASKRRDSKLWSETFDVRLGNTEPLSPKEIKRQEAIFELAQGEQDLVEDLKLAKKAYRDPMLKLSIMTEEELNQIFGTLDSLIPLHEDLLSRLRDARKPDGSTEQVGHILTDWLPCLSSYTPYCSNQVKAKALLDQKKQERRVQDFLQRCIQSPFSRKLDLWNFLDIPRSRLVKYPLLLREILKHTANDHPDRQILDEAMVTVQSVVADINRRTGESECQYYKERLLYAEDGGRDGERDGQRDSLIERSRTLSCHGELKNNRGLKLHVFLFQDVLVITRAVSLADQPVSFQLCRQPIPIRQLDLEDLSDGEMRVGGSIRGAFSNNERTKNFFRVSSRGGGRLQSHYFQASDAFNKQQWINCIRQATEAAAMVPDLVPEWAGQCPEATVRCPEEMRQCLEEPGRCLEVEQCSKELGEGLEDTRGCAEEIERCPGEIGQCLKIGQCSEDSSQCPEKTGQCLEQTGRFPDEMGICLEMGQYLETGVCSEVTGRCSGMGGRLDMGGCRDEAGCPEARQCLEMEGCSDIGEYLVIGGCPGTGRCPEDMGGVLETEKYLGTEQSSEAKLMGQIGQQVQTCLSLGGDSGLENDTVMSGKVGEEWEEMGLEGEVMGEEGKEIGEEQETRLGFSEGKIEEETELDLERQTETTGDWRTEGTLRGEEGGGALTPPPPSANPEEEEEEKEKDVVMETMEEEEEEEEEEDSLIYRC